MILLNDDLFNITNSWEWTICLNEPVNNIVTLFGQNETQKRKDRLLEHISWKKTFGKKGSFRIINTKYCLQFLRLERGRDEWLFLGAFEVNGYHTTSNGDEVYDLAIMQDCSLNKYAERLIVKYHKKQGPKQAKIMWKTYLQFELSEILGDIYFSVINIFPGYDEVCLDFSKLVSIYSIPYRSWQEALSIINGIYVITDTSNGKQYVGSTYGYNGVWQRWEGYVKTNGHGNDKNLMNLINNDPNYAIKNFQFSLIEYFFNTDNKQSNSYIIKREEYWKNVLKTKKFGYNI